MKKLVVLASLLMVSAAVLPSQASTDSTSSTTTSVSAPAASRFSCPCPAFAAQMTAAISKHPYAYLVAAFIAGVLATKAVDAYIANQELDEDYDF